MNKRVIVYVLGAVLLIEAALMLLPLLVAVIYREKNGWYFLWVLLGAAVLGALALGLGGRKRSAMYAKEGQMCIRDRECPCRRSSATGFARRACSGQAAQPPAECSNRSS